MNKTLPEEIKCSMCPKGTMEKSRLGPFHQYYTCKNSKCKDTIGLPLAQYGLSNEKDYKESDNDFGSGSYKSRREDD